jgi:hypothetical protein
MPPVTTAGNVVAVRPAALVSGDCTMYAKVPTHWHTVQTGNVVWSYAWVALDDVPSFDHDKATFHRTRPELIRQYAGKYVAIYNGRVAAVGDSDNETARAFFADHPDADVYIG